MEKVYKDGYNMYGEEISIHYFQSESGKVFNVIGKIDQGDQKDVRSTFFGREEL